MNKLTNEEIARVFAMYLGCDIEPMTSTFGGYSRNDRYLTIENISNILARDKKLKLKRFNKISDYDVIEFIKLLDERSFEGYSIKRNLFNEPMIRVNVANDHSAFDFSINSNFSVRYCRCGAYSNYPITYEAFLFLISNGYEVPLFFTPNHWANGKTPIELGIAIESL